MAIGSQGKICRKFDDLKMIEIVITAKSPAIIAYMVCISKLFKPLDFQGK
jgi:hypothetical protein